MSFTFWARTDSNSANNPALNLTGAPATEITFLPSGTNGDVILEGGGTADPDTEVQIDGVNYSFSFEFQGTTPTANNQGANQLPTELRNEDVILITVFDYPGPGDTTRLVFFSDIDATEAQMNSIGNGRINLSNIDTTGPGVICFAEGTLIATPKGDRPVESLRVGDLVMTVDDGPMPIKWIACTDHKWPGAEESDLPVLISKDALEAGQPQRDLVISPQHKVLLECPTSGTGVLAPAKGLIGLPGIRVMRGKKRVSYYHVLLERHALLLSEGLASESLFPGPVSLKAVGARHRLSLTANLTARGGSYGKTARPCLTLGETLALASELRAARTKVFAAE